MNYALPLQAFTAQVTNNPDEIYLNQPHHGRWTSYSWAQVDNHARRIASALQAQGFKAGDRIAILSKNCAEWIITDLATMMAGMVSVPIYATAGVETIQHVVTHSGAKAVFVGKLDSFDAAKAVLDGSVLRVGFPYPTVATDMQWGDWLRDYAPLQEIASLGEDEVMTIVYTSGSTGLPKGVALTYRNLGVSGEASGQKLYSPERDRCLSYLPLAHITERTSVEMGSFNCGMELFFTETLDTFVNDLNHAKPTVFISVPRLWTRFQSQVLARFPGTELQSLLQQPETGEALAAQIREQLGFGHGRIFGSGSAPIAPSLLEWFDKLGVPISEGWGMTETSGMACINLPYEPEGLGTIGRPIDGVEMKLSDEGEVLIRGDVVFSEYYRDPEATAEAFIDGWFRTGDRGEITETGHFKIIGRLKDQFKTAKGKYVAPVPIESMLAHNPDVEQVCVLGAGRKQPIAVVVLAEELRNDATQVERISERLKESLKLINEKLESHQRLDNILVSDTSWTVDNGLLTPTLKIRRNKVEEIYADILTYRMPTPVYWL